MMTSSSSQWWIQNLFTILEMFFTFLVPGVFLSSALRRKLVSDQESRIGPSLSGFGGFLQPIADEIVILARSPRFKASRKLSFWNSLCYLSITLALFSIPVSGTSYAFESEISIWLFPLAITGFYFSVSGLLRSFGGVDSVIHLIQGVPTLLSSVFPFLFVILSAGVAYGSFDWKVIQELQSQAWFGFGIVSHPELLAGWLICFCISFPLVQMFREVREAFREQESPLYLLYRFGHSTFELLWFSFMTALFFGGGHLPSVLMGLIADPFISLFEAAFFLLKTLILQTVFEITNVLVPRLNARRTTSFAWRFLGPAAVLSTALNSILASLRGAG